MEAWGVTLGTLEKDRGFPRCRAAAPGLSDLDVTPFYPPRHEVQA